MIYIRVWHTRGNACCLVGKDGYGENTEYLLCTAYPYMWLRQICRKWLAFMKETMSNSPNHYAVVIIQISHHLNQTEIKGDDTDQIDNQRYDRPLDEQFLFLHHTIHNTDNCRDQYAGSYPEDALYRKPHQYQQSHGYQNVVSHICLRS